MCDKRVGKALIDMHLVCAWGGGMASSTHTTKCSLYDQNTHMKPQRDTHPCSVVV